MLWGNAADNLLSGGLGRDTLMGGAGNDIYHVSSGDVVIEETGAGVDMVISDVSWVLSSNQENLMLSGSLSINATGNALANLLVGNHAANELDGGEGADKMIGGEGADVYWIDDEQDFVVENVDEGSDQICSRVDMTLPAHVENLTLVGESELWGTGNSLDNLLQGNARNMC